MYEIPTIYSQIVKYLEKNFLLKIPFTHWQNKQKAMTIERASYLSGNKRRGLLLLGRFSLVWSHSKFLPGFNVYNVKVTFECESALLLEGCESEHSQSSLRRAASLERTLTSFTALWTGCKQTTNPQTRRGGGKAPVLWPPQVRLWVLGPRHLRRPRRAWRCPRSTWTLWKRRRSSSGGAAAAVAPAPKLSV